MRETIIKVIMIESEKQNNFRYAVITKEDDSLYNNSFVIELLSKVGPNHSNSYRTDLGLDVARWLAEIWIQHATKGVDELMPDKCGWFAPV